MNNGRRSFLTYAGMAALAVAAVPAARTLAVASHGAGAGGSMMPRPEARTAKRWAMVVDTRKLTTEEDFEPLIEACHSFHNVPHIDTRQNIKWIWHDEFEAAFPEQLTRFPEEARPKVMDRPMLLMCNHCQYPPCVRVCPTKATFKTDDGIVMMDMHRCIGCRYCMAGCPYGARSFNFSDPRKHLDMAKVNRDYPTRMKGVVEKCTFCIERLAEGQMPACVEAAKGALLFGDLADPSSPVATAIRNNFVVRRKPELGTSPNVYYII